MIPPSSIGSDEERGAALLTALLLVSVIAVIAVTSLDRLMLSTRLTGNAAAMAQARAFTDAAENVALSQAALLSAGGPGEVVREAVEAGLGKARRIPVDEGSIEMSLDDGGNCFNLNSLVRLSGGGVLVRDPPMGTTFVNLLGLLGFDANRANRIAASATDWIDSDDIALPGGAEDTAYRRRSPGYLPPDGMMAHASELKAVDGMDAEAWARIEPFVCALPEAEPSKINVNTLRPDQAMLLSMLDPASLPPALAKSLLANRPAAGYADLQRFWSQPQLSKMKNAVTFEQTAVRSRYFLMEARVDYGDIAIGERALIDASRGRPYVLWRQEMID